MFWVGHPLYATDAPAMSSLHLHGNGKARDDQGEFGGTGEWCKMGPISYKFVRLFKPTNIH